MRGVRVLLPLCAVIVFLLPGAAQAQVASIAGTVRDPQGQTIPGVTVEVTSPALIEKVRTSVTDTNGRYQILGLPVGTYKVTFTLQNFVKVVRENIALTSDVTAPVNAEMKPGDLREVVTVRAEAPPVDVQNARQLTVFTSEEIRDLPTTRNLSNLIQLVPGIALGGNGGTSIPEICSGGMADGAGGAFGSASGALSGCSPILGAFNSHSSMNDPNSLNQGRIQVDGMGIQSFAGGGRSSYIPDVANAQEVTFTLSGSLGESETGGATINIVPRTGGNRYAGNFFTAYSSGKFFDRNDGTRRSAFAQRLDKEYDVNASYGGPIIRDRLWFQSVVRRQERDNILFSAYRNLNEGRFAANYSGDANSPIMQNDLYQNANLRLTLQATQRNKFNLFWDQQYTCENPCKGTANGMTSPEASPSILTSPLHVAQVNWTNPLSNKILLDAGISHYSSHRDETQNRWETAYPSIPRVVETGATIQLVPGTGLQSLTSGSINNATYWNNDNIQSRASASYVTGSHNVKLGYQGGYLSQVSRPSFNDMRLQYNYATPAGTCTSGPTANLAAGSTGTGAPTPGTVSSLTTTWCGLLQDGRRAYDGLDPSQPIGAPLSQVVGTQTVSQAGRLPVPASVTQYIPTSSDQAVWFSAFYLQDQWTFNRFTLNGALRYDHSQSKYNKTCVGPDLYLTSSYCLNDPAAGDSGDGVNFQDLTPRWSVAWDVFGNGRTALKFNMGKYVNGAGISGIYTAGNPASGGRTVNSYQRTWKDLDGDRIVDCDLQVPPVAPPAGSSLPTNGECGGESSGNTANARRFGRSPNDLDELGLAIGLNTIYCGMDEPSMTQAVRNYCNNYMNAGGSSLLNGWNKRTYEWQMGFGIQHELLPRLTMDATYNRRISGNQTVNDVIGSGCDLYSQTTDPGAVNATQCMEDQFNLQSSFYDFYGVRAPEDDRLPGHGGYLVSGIATRKLDPNNPAALLPLPATSTTAITIVPDGTQRDVWQGVDVNFTLRAKGGLRVTGGTSTGRRSNDTCDLQVDDPPTGQVLREGKYLTCNPVRPFQTNMRGTATYTIPWVDVLFSSVFSYRPGVDRSATYTVNVSTLEWGPNSQSRVGSTSLPSSTGGAAAATVAQNLLSNRMYGEGIRLFDIKLAKNFRFNNKRVNVGMDIYNVFNSDAALGYCNTFPNCGTVGAASYQPWSQVTNITTPRYGRFQVQFDF